MSDEGQPFPLTSCYRGPAFRAIEAVLREYGPLAEHIRSWRTRSGDPDDMALPGLGEMPCIALSPVPRPSMPKAIDLTDINFAVSIQVFVEGTRVDDILAVVEAIEDALVESRPFRADAVPGQTVAKFLCSILNPGRGMRMLRLEIPAFFPADVAIPNRTPGYQRGDGMLTCNILRPA